MSGCQQRMRQPVAECDRESGLCLAKVGEWHLQDFTHPWTVRAAGQVHVSGTEAAGLRTFGFLERKICFVGFFIRLFRFRVGQAVVLSQEER